MSSADILQVSYFAFIFGSSWVYCLCMADYERWSGRPYDEREFDDAYGVTIMPIVLSLVSMAATVESFFILCAVLPSSLDFEPPMWVVFCIGAGFHLCVLFFVHVRSESKSKQTKSSS